ncbi:hypothetical protein LSAT2_004519, partial [Lamellibrachia satsuma]
YKSQEYVGHHVQESRVSQSMRRVNPAVVALRWGNSAQRRTYNVQSSQSLWHIDGNYKLVRWKLIIHGGTDGYSRLVVFVNVASNNMASTVLKTFVTATEAYGIPSRVRIWHPI